MLAVVVLAMMSAVRMSEGTEIELAGNDVTMGGYDYQYQYLRSVDLRLQPDDPVLETGGEEVEGEVEVEEVLEEVGEGEEVEVMICDPNNPHDSGLDQEVYHGLCNGTLKNVWPLVTPSDLVCWYHKGNARRSHPDQFLRLSPVKMERLAFWPDLVLIHSMITESQIAEIIGTVSSRLGMSNVTGELKDGEKPADYGRDSQNSWVSAEESPAVAQLTNTLSVITGFNMSNAEEMQVVLYDGEGTRYEPHFDTMSAAQDDPIKFNLNTHGNRVATILFYLNEVDQGGFTAFPCAGTAAEPTKGAAILWNNMGHDGNLLVESLHAGCPIVRGRKWVANWWVREKGPWQARGQQHFPFWFANICPLDPREMYFGFDF